MITTIYHQLYLNNNEPRVGDIFMINSVRVLLSEQEVINFDKYDFTPIEINFKNLKDIGFEEKHIGNSLKLCYQINDYIKLVTLMNDDDLRTIHVIYDDGDICQLQIVLYDKKAIHINIIQRMIADLKADTENNSIT